MLHVATVDDRKEDRDTIERLLKKSAARGDISVTVEQFENALAFFAGFEVNYDLVFLDVEMPHMSGMEAAKKLREADGNVAIIFVTNFVKYAVKGYEVEAMDYIVKPVDEYDFALKMTRILPRICVDKGNTVLIHTAERCVVKVAVCDIYYIEVQGHYVIFHTASGIYSEYTTLKKVEREISSGSFARCNRCYMVNLRWVRMIDKESVTVGKDVLAISRSQKKIFYDAYAAYVSGRGGSNV